MTSVPTPEAEEFFAGAARGELRIQRCRHCGQHHHYPRSLCPHCGSDALEWITASGSGVVHSFTVIRQHGFPPWRDQVPFVVALVDLDEGGARLLAQMPTTEPDAVRIGMRVRASFRTVGNGIALVDVEPA